MERLKMKNFTAKERKKIHKWFRAGIQLLFFIFMPSAYTAAFAGVKYIFTQLGAGARIEFTSFVAVLLVLCGYSIIFGRFFCGFACAFGSLGDGMHGLYVWICKKRKKKAKQIPERFCGIFSNIKYIILFLIILCCFTGIYGKAKGSSPWDVFSMLHALNFQLSGYVLGSCLLVFILIGMCLKERFFCRFLCPMGAVFSFLPMLPFLTLKRNRDNCIKGCNACGRNCPSNIGLPSEGSVEVSGECFQCQKCIDICPKMNIHTGIRRIKGNEIWFTAVRALILAGLFYRMGI